MQVSVGGRPGAFVRALGSLSVLMCSGAAHGQSGENHYFYVNEIFHKVDNLKITSKSKLVKHCYSAKDHPYRYSVVDMPVSLASGTVQTAEFSPSTSWYWIMIQVEKPLPTHQIMCMTGTTSGLLSKAECSGNDPVLQADWSVLEDGKEVKNGSSRPEADAKYTTDHVLKFLGSFPALADKKYVLQVTFTKDGTPLNLAHPHLIIAKQGNE